MVWRCSNLTWAKRTRVVGLVMGMTSACSTNGEVKSQETVTTATPTTPGADANGIAWEPGDREAVEKCRQTFPNLGNPGEVIDRDTAWKACMQATGKDAGACDLAAILTAQAAVCVAQHFDFQQELQWRVRLQVLAFPRPRVTWSISLPSGAQHLVLDAHTGQRIAHLGAR